jgi:UDP-N-acetylmuramoyl-L-alanyl-D-glutamate--2,6-diaminopimelate ligase
MAKAGCAYAFMEVSSHAADQGRVAGANFAGGIFTNLTHDHLDYHKTLARYAAAKNKFFKMLPRGSFALANSEDKAWKKIVSGTKAKVLTYAVGKKADVSRGALAKWDFSSTILENSMEGLKLSSGTLEGRFKLIGTFNAHNLLAAYAAAVLLKQPKEKVWKTLQKISGPTGRCEYVKDRKNRMAVVDYAHSPDAVSNVLRTLCDVRDPNSKIITVIGCGGDRDHTKRPIMAKIAYDLSNRVVLTSDNPRSEDPNVILQEMLAGLSEEEKKNVLVEPDRRAAIQMAITESKPGDIILIAGKGHEDYQEIQGVKHHFSDREEVERSFLASTAS